MTNIIEVENKMVTLRDQQVILDSDVAELYDVETKRVNEAVSNNPEKFPEGYIWELTEEEVLVLRPGHAWIPSLVKRYLLPSTL